MPPTRQSLGHENSPVANSRLARLLARLRGALLSAVEEEMVRQGNEAVTDDHGDVLEKLPDPPPHLDIGDVKYFDGKFRYF